MKKTKERMQDIDDTITFFQAGGPPAGSPTSAPAASDSSAAGPAAPGAAASGSAAPPARRRPPPRLRRLRLGIGKPAEQELPTEAGTFGAIVLSIQRRPRSQTRRPR